MPIFKVNNKKLQLIKETKIDLEKEIQALTETNLEEIFNFKLICSEFQLQNLRIDTLAFDQESKSFVIIEYKRDRSFSVIDQGYAYLGLMLNNKADFILEYNEKMSSNLKRGDIDWSQSKVIFIANSFTAYQEKALNFKDLPIELWEVKRFDNSTILYNQLKSADSNESIKTVSKNQTVESVSREVKKYTTEDHFKKDWVESRELYNTINQEILKLDDRLEVVPTKYYIGYKIGNFVLFDLSIQKSKIILELYRVQPKDLKDPEKRTFYKNRSIEFYNKHVTDYIINSEEDITYATFLIKQVYERFKK